MNKGSVNLVMLIGKLIEDPIKDIDDSGKEKSSFVLRTVEQLVNDNNKKELREDHHCRMSDYNAEDSNKRLKEGDMVYIEGILEKKNFTNNDGIRMNRVEVIVKRFTILEKDQYSSRTKYTDLPFDDEELKRDEKNDKTNSSGKKPPL